MIMLGTTPRRLGRRSALLAFAVAAALLPLTPSWAQKPKEEEKEVKVQAYAFEVADDSAAKQAGEVKSEVHVVVATDDDKREIKADSLDKAVELIKRKIEALAKDGDKSANHTAKLKGLKQALVELEKARDKVVILKVGKPHPHIFELQAVLEAESEAKLSAEAREKLDKAKARVESLRKELRQAEEELLKLSGHAANAQQGEGGVVVLREARGPREERVVVVGKPVKDKDVWTKSTQALTLLGGESAAKSSDHARLESLEKKLEKLLDEVAKLKKDEKKDK